MSIQGKVTLITGSAGGIGKATALRFAKAGAKLVICDINPEALAQTKAEIEELGAEVLAIQYNARNIADIKKVFDAMIDKYKTIDILVNNTGIAGPIKPIIDIDVEEWDETMEINLRSMYYCIKLAAPYMIAKKQGKIVNLSSITGKRSLINRTPYCASKIGVIGLTRCVAEELGMYDINVNAVCPGAVSGARRDMLIAAAAKRNGTTLEEESVRSLKASFIKRAVPPEDIAQLILFLSDDEQCRSITGQDFNINCGLTTY